MLPAEAAFWNRFRAVALDVFGCYGYVPIETPVFEQTDLFVRGIGSATDVVSKEMYTAVSGPNLQTLIDGGELDAAARLTLRPEGTAGVVRAVAQNGLVQQGGAPVKVVYAGPMFRAERPQKGRQRQFNQIGVECLGADDATVDAEGIIMAMRFFETIGIPRSSMRLLVNSMGCADCRPAYRDAVKAFIESHADDMCDECRTRADVNPLRAFDCKNPGCAAIMKDAPRITDALCDDCRAHYTRVLSLLDAVGVDYTEDPTLVRGLDYYTRTVFEVQVDDGMGAQNAIGGGGRYDGLMGEIAGNDCPGFGFALGYERCRIACEAAGIAIDDAGSCDVYVAAVDDSVRDRVFTVMQSLRDVGIRADCDHQGRSLKSQFKQADRMGATITAILGPDEVAAGTVTVRDMATHTEQAAAIDAVADAVTALLQHPER